MAPTSTFRVSKGQEPGGPAADCKAPAPGRAASDRAPFAVPAFVGLEKPDATANRSRNLPGLIQALCLPVTLLCRNAFADRGWGMPGTTGRRRFVTCPAAPNGLASPHAFRDPLRSVIEMVKTAVTSRENRARLDAGFSLAFASWRGPLYEFVTKTRHSPGAAAVCASRAGASAPIRASLVAYADSHRNA